MDFYINKRRNDYIDEDLHFLNFSIFLYSSYLKDKRLLGDYCMYLDNNEEKLIEEFNKLRHLRGD